MDGTIFTYEFDTPLEFEVATTDLSKAGTYPLTLIANINGYTNIATLLFEVILINPCLAGSFNI